ncbi:peptidoglycan/xylan/chitin deacetylase (PgdA/CDA1 family) [Paenibacillus shirakamiensis]|uniref:Peptidoglycan/xylan/chitin deacetylase (PgdA/CDA1 family) n=1 Tax=Paenibacillus shirakamiensis TaxID=1265935 RepID=A0ABS4JLV7_9BACL|nr:polysaccharide deacetylase family protein [Paenibacillus shirakamiensis]MBP2001956.1 peptidoglycan/xylan/chitin deacetylase (PgdA/CDA1 family) [Paenibacillus shirakamiensis]
MPKNNSLFVISLDFELYWGLRDVWPLTHYQNVFAGERGQIPQVLKLFECNGIHATWATVGMLFARNRDHLEGHLPREQPQYQEEALSPYPHLADGQVGWDEKSDPNHYALGLIRQIQGTAGQRIASHTFSHYYCQEAGQQSEDFLADMQAAVKIAEEEGVSLDTMVFPRNQVRSDYLPLLGQVGIRAYRGNPKHALYRAGYSRHDSWFKRAFRLLDAYLNLTGYHTYSEEEIDSKYPMNLPASHFLRSYSHNVRLLEPLRLRRILKGMTQAAERGEAYHLWCHPYNLVDNQGRCYQVLVDIVEHYKKLRTTFGMESLNMEELCERVARKDRTQKLNAERV